MKKNLTRREAAFRERENANYVNSAATRNDSIKQFQVFSKAYLFFQLHNIHFT